jgi:hypothetical protein
MRRECASRFAAEGDLCARLMISKFVPQQDGDNKVVAARSNGALFLSNASATLPPLLPCEENHTCIRLEPA